MANAYWYPYPGSVSYPYGFSMGSWSDIWHLRLAVRGVHVLHIAGQVFGRDGGGECHGFVNYELVR